MSGRFLCYLRELGRYTTFTHTHGRTRFALSVDQSQRVSRLYLGLILTPLPGLTYPTSQQSTFLTELKGDHNAPEFGANLKDKGGVSFFFLSIYVFCGRHLYRQGYLLKEPIKQLSTQISLG